MATGGQGCQAAQPSTCSWESEPLHPAFRPQFPDRTGVSQLHRVLHVPGPTEHLPPAEPDHRGRSPAHGPEPCALALAQSRPLLPALPKGGKVGESGKTLLPETKPNLLSHVWLPIESALEAPGRSAAQAGAGWDPRLGPWQLDCSLGREASPLYPAARLPLIWGTGCSQSTESCQGQKGLGAGAAQCHLHEEKLRPTEGKTDPCRTPTTPVYPGFRWCQARSKRPWLISGSDKNTSTESLLHCEGRHWLAA